MTRYRIILIFAGIAATAIIAFTTTMAHRVTCPPEGCVMPPWLEMQAAMLLTFAVGLGIGRLLLRGGNGA
ncbi:MAG TPA: hypothetical protein VGE05_03405 [Novosphingobium sp.]